MKLGKKIGLAFGAVTLITTILGVLSYIMFGRVSNEVNTLSEHSLPKVQQSTGVERAALSVLVHQKNYRLYEKEEDVQAARQQLAALSASLDEVDKIAAKFNDTTLAEKSREVRKGEADWASLFEDFVSNIKSSSEMQTTRVQKGIDVMAKIDAYVKDEMAALALNRSIFAAYDDFDDIGYGCRQAANEYVLAAKPEFLDIVRKGMPQVMAGYDGVEKMTLSADDKKHVDEGRDAAQAFDDLFEKTVAARQAGGTVDDATAKLIADAGDTMMEKLEDFKDMKSAALYKIMGMTDAARSIDTSFLQMRYDTRVYQEGFGNDASVKAWADLTSLNDDVTERFAALRKQADTPEEQQRIDHAAQGIVDYVALSKTWKEVVDNINAKIVPNIHAIADTTLAAAQETESDAWKATADGQTAVLGIVTTSKVAAVIALLAGIILSTVIGILITLSITKPAREGVIFVQRMAEGDLTQRLESSAKDELGDLTRAMNGMGTNLHGMFVQIRKNGTSLSDASQELSAVSAQVSSNSEETSAQAGVVAAAAEQVSKNINTVATAAEEMTASVREIAQQATNASKVAGEAVTLADRTNTTINKLGESSAEVGNVIKVITTIAAQTNLLALNATIEAARAGESGKGFAVVANEVKELARQTALASNDIAQKIGTIQSDSVEAVKAIQEIGKIIRQIDEIQTSIAGAVEEQAVTTSEISRNVNEAALGSSDIAKNIASVSEVASNSTQAAGSTAAAASELSRLASDLNEVVGQFKLEGSDSFAAAQSKPARRPAAKNGHAPKAGAEAEEADLEPATQPRWGRNGHTNGALNGTH